MIKMLVAFVFLAVLIGVAVQAWRGLRGLEKWRLTKIAILSIVCAALAVGLLTIFVLLF